MRWMKQNKMVLIIFKALKRKKINSNQKTTYYWNRQDKNSDNSSRNISTIQSSTSKSESIFYMKLIIELVRQFPGILNPKLNCFKDHA